MVVERPGAPFVLKDILLDEIRDDEVLVEMKYTGLCHTVSAYWQEIHMASYQILKLLC